MADETMSDETRCPCGLGAPYATCCGRLHRGDREAVTAEQLMRARYSAFARGDEAYLVRSWHPSNRPRRVRIDSSRRWTALEVLATTEGGLLDQEGTVEFRAHHQRGAELGVLHERSLFGRLEGRWVYVGPLETA